MAVLIPCLLIMRQFLKSKKSTILTRFANSVILNQLIPLPAPWTPYTKLGEYMILLAKFSRENPLCVVETWLSDLVPPFT